MRPKPAVRVATYVVVGALSLVGLTPILWTALTGLRAESLAVTYPPRLNPLPLTTENLVTVMSGNLPRFMANSGILALGTIALALLAGSAGAYAASRFRFRGKEALLLLVMATVMIPGVSVIVPTFLMFSRLGLSNTYHGLVLLYTAWQLPLVLWILRGFVDSIPRDLDEAALIDGASRLQIFRHVIAPLLRPGLAAAGTIIFINVWNEFLFGLALTSTTAMRPVQTGIYLEISSYGIVWSRMMSAATISIIPVAAVFFIFQKYLLKGMVAGATKG